MTSTGKGKVAQMPEDLGVPELPKFREREFSQKDMEFLLKRFWRWENGLVQGKRTDVESEINDEYCSAFGVPEKWDDGGVWTAALKTKRLKQIKNFYNNNRGRIVAMGGGVITTSFNKRGTIDLFDNRRHRKMRWGQALISVSPEVGDTIRKQWEVKKAEDPTVQESGWLKYLNDSADKEYAKIEDEKIKRDAAFLRDNGHKIDEPPKNKDPETADDYLENILLAQKTLIEFALAFKKKTKMEAYIFVGGMVPDVETARVLNWHYVTDNGWLEKLGKAKCDEHIFNPLQASLEEKFADDRKTFRLTSHDVTDEEHEQLAKSCEQLAQEEAEIEAAKGINPSVMSGLKTIEEKGEDHISTTLDNGKSKVKGKAKATPKRKAKPKPKAKAQTDTEEVGQVSASSKTSRGAKGKGKYMEVDDTAADDTDGGACEDEQPKDDKVDEDTVDEDEANEVEVDEGNSHHPVRAYQEIRQKQIARNRELMVELGLDEAASSISAQRPAARPKKTPVSVEASTRVTRSKDKATLSRQEPNAPEGTPEPRVDLLSESQLSGADGILIGAEQSDEREPTSTSELRPHEIAKTPEAAKEQESAEVNTSNGANNNTTKPAKDTRETRSRPELSKSDDPLPLVGRPEEEQDVPMTEVPATMPEHQSFADKEVRPIQEPMVVDETGDSTNRSVRSTSENDADSTTQSMPSLPAGNPPSPPPAASPPASSPVYTPTYTPSSLPASPEQPLPPPPAPARPAGSPTESPAGSVPASPVAPPATSPALPPAASPNPPTVAPPTLPPVVPAMQASISASSEGSTSKRKRLERVTKTDLAGREKVENVCRSLRSVSISEADLDQTRRLPRKQKELFDVLKKADMPGTLRRLWVTLLGGYLRIEELREWPSYKGAVSNKDTPASIKAWLKDSARGPGYFPDTTKPSTFASHWKKWLDSVTLPDNALDGELFQGGGGLMLDMLFFFSWWARSVSNVKALQARQEAETQLQAGLQSIVHILEGEVFPGLEGDQTKRQRVEGPDDTVTY